jgi:ABC-type antimicrobial peptide transport system permease subunit
MVLAGLYGVLAQLVSYRRREFGIRLALGATPRGILGMVLRQGLVFVGADLALGIAAAVFAGNLVKSFRYHKCSQRMRGRIPVSSLCCCLSEVRRRSFPGGGPRQWSR